VVNRKATLSGVQPKGTDRIQFDFRIAGVRYRPTIYRAPTEANLRRAYQQLREIKARIKSGRFNFDEEFPDYRYKADAPNQREDETRTCDDVFKNFLSHCEMRVAMDDLAFSTLDGYRDILDGVWAPKIGATSFEKVVYSELAKIAAAHTRKKKTYNNVVSAVRTAFKFGYKDLPGKFNPALALSTFRITKKDRPPVDPFTISDAETIISASHGMHGEWYGNYEEFRFFTGLRQSEQFALEVSDCDLIKGTISITKAVVLSRKKNRTKTNQDREIELCPRALEVLRAQLSLRERMVAAGKIHDDYVFFSEGGEPLLTVYLPYNRWREVMETLTVRYRKPYNARHTFISWRLMKGDNPLLVAQEDGHSVETMLRTYAAWIKGAQPEDIEGIKKAMAGRPSTNGHSPDSDVHGPLESPQMGTKWPPAEQTEGHQPSNDSTNEIAAGQLTDCSSNKKRKKCGQKNWLGWKDSNLRMAGSKPAALPLGDTPTWKKTDDRHQPGRNPSSKGESFSPRARKPSNSGGILRIISCARSLFSQAKKTQAPVPVRRAEPKTDSQSSACATSG
jgi:integrase